LETGGEGRVRTADKGFLIQGQGHWLKIGSNRFSDSEKSAKPRASVREKTIVEEATGSDSAENESLLD
jgi:hydroxymethylglutaryl-CoA reductase